MSDIDLQRASRERIRNENRGDPSWVDLGDGYFALHIQYGGNAVVVNVGTGSQDIEAFREWLAYHWPTPDGDQLHPTDAPHAAPESR